MTECAADSGQSWQAGQYRLSQQQPDWPHQHSPHHPLPTLSVLTRTSPSSLSVGLSPVLESSLSFGPPRTPSAGVGHVAFTRAAPQSPNKDTITTFPLLTVAAHSPLGKYLRTTVYCLRLRPSSLAPRLKE